MTQNNKFRSGIRLVRLVAVIFLVNGCKPMYLPNSQLSAEWFAWDEDLVDLDHIFPSGGSSGDEAAGQADTHHEPFAGGHLHPIGLPAGPSASHVCPPQDYHHIQTAAEQRPSGTLAHGKRMSLDLHNLFGSGFEPAQNFELLDQLLADGTPASNGFAAAGASRALDHIFPSALSSQARAAGQANHPQPSSALASDQSLLPDYYYPAQTNAKERTVNSQPYHALDISFDSGELFEPGLLPHDFDILTEFLGHGTPDPDGLTGVLVRRICPPSRIIPSCAPPAQPPDSTKVLLVSGSKLSGFRPKASNLRICFSPRASHGAAYPNCTSHFLKANGLRSLKSYLHRGHWGII
ncbi:hypothetical protein, variant [Puccinia triticina 1-1 BBBD Race 1]|uniref:Uncharacterized protein n=1 Tax=Puccinia triticina (isolate 1-1 / race 1 (BBBD)) TaxID=630390 RepID=A0A180GHE4_PUCT1|nr:hypothetical protein, variant [Puccinia triticina 1-1 BBBD Race 1]